MQTFRKIRPQNRKKPNYYLMNPWISLKEQPNLVFHLIDQQAKEIHPPVVWWNGHLYYELNPGVLRPIKEQEALEWWKRRLVG
ncbi:hypothetical protein [Thermococcus sp. 9N3]|uniref:hypothetical protein n=1 Tax=Thermococcus sp. 9N3 TaxID=163002 RepID=UPI00142F6F6A|nr:hypothetical protein [Thermococcus sp. 9N3]NJE50073.1 hypothetical protein [Thermococcus sp. 9N3]